MAFSPYRTVWQLRPGVSAPFAAKEEAPTAETAPVAAAPAEQASTAAAAAPAQAAAPSAAAAPVQAPAPASVQAPAAAASAAAPASPAPVSAPRTKAAAPRSTPLKPQSGASPELQAAADSIVAGALQAQREQQARLKTQSSVKAPAQPAKPVRRQAPMAPRAPAPAAQRRPQPVLKLYLSADLKLSYLDSLLAFLTRKGVSFEKFTEARQVKRPALVLLSPGALPPPACLCFVPDENKAALWSFLKREMPELA